ncbi:hypothetical protein FACS1894110_02380 [Spirochaetia bacterium]|nr:hypothetical protein FACS1894110_02380 [Spirochaetia bacterium]
MPNSHPYQLRFSQWQAVKKIDVHFSNDINPVCALPPGKGKTAVACEIIQSFRAKGPQNIAIIIKAVNFKNPWVKELEAYSILYKFIHGKKRDEYLSNKAYLINKGNVFITTYDTALIDIDRILNMGGFDLIVYDELHTVINPEKLTQKSRLFAYLSSKRKLALTATPVQNTINDIGLMHLLLNNPKALSDVDIDNAKMKKSLFEESVKDAIEKNIVILCLGDTLTSGIPSSSKKPKLKIEKRKVILSIPIYNEMKKTIGDILADNRCEDKKYINLQKLMSFLSHPDSIYKNNSVDIPPMLCTKVDAVKIIVDMIPKNEKIIVFSQYVDVLNCYYKLFKDMGYDSLILTGKDRCVDVDRKLTQFNNIESFKFLLTTIFKSSEGLNLETANHVIILEFWWNPQKIIQAMGRIDRLSQTKNIFVYMLCYNEDGGLFKYEGYYYDTMLVKIKDARIINPAQMDLPDVKVFSNQDTFKTEFQSYIDGFLKPPIIPFRKKVTIKGKGKLIGLPPAEPTSDKSRPQGKEAQSENDGASSSALQESLLDLWVQQNLPEDSRFDGLDLTKGSQDED